MGRVVQRPGSPVERPDRRLWVFLVTVQPPSPSQALGRALLFTVRTQVCASGPSLLLPSGQRTGKPGKQNGAVVETELLQHQDPVPPVPTPRGLD